MQRSMCQMGLLSRGEKRGEKRRGGRESSGATCEARARVIVGRKANEEKPEVRREGQRGGRGAKGMSMGYEDREEEKSMKSGKGHSTTQDTDTTKRNQDQVTLLKKYALTQEGVFRLYQGTMRSLIDCIARRNGWPNSEPWSLPETFTLTWTGRRIWRHTHPRIRASCNCRRSVCRRTHRCSTPTCIETSTIVERMESLRAW